MPNTGVKSPWRMSKTELTAELTALRVAVHPKWTVPELRATLIEQRQSLTPEVEHKLKGITSMKLEELIKKAEENGVELPAKPTRGLVIRLLRDASQEMGDSIMTFGRYKTWMYREVPETYMEWAVKEHAAKGKASDPQLAMFAIWAEEELRKRTLVKSAVPKVRPVADDPEATARIPVPEVETWSWSSTGSTDRSSARVGRGVRRSFSPQPRAEMKVEVPEAEAEEIRKLETRLAVLKQKNQITPTPSP